MNIGPTELIVILVIALIVFGPKRLPEVGRTVGKSLREFRRATLDLKDELQIGLDDEPAARSSRSSSPAASSAATTEPGPTSAAPTNGAGEPKETGEWDATEAARTESEASGTSQPS
jgi:sec-independent protein translocase protein TatA